MNQITFRWNREEDYSLKGGFHIRVANAAGRPTLLMNFNPHEMFIYPKEWKMVFATVNGIQIWDMH